MSNTKRSNRALRLVPNPYNAPKQPNLHQEDNSNPSDPTKRQGTPSPARPSGYPDVNPLSKERLSMKPNGPTDPTQAQSADGPGMTSDKASDVSRQLSVTGVPLPQGDRRRRVWTEADMQQNAEAVAKVLATFVPLSLRDENPAVLAEVMATTRECVASAQPPDVDTARHWIWAAAPMLLWLQRKLGSVDVVMLNHRNVEAWVNKVNKHKSNGWRHLARIHLRRIGRAANPDGWPQPPKPISRVPIALPYDPQTEAAFGRVAGLPRPTNKEGRLWVAGGGLGAALNGIELHAAKTSDLHEFPEGRLAIQVRGQNPRLVPIRACWTEAVRQAAQIAEEREGERSVWLIRARDKNAVSRLARSLDFGQGGLTLRRARSTWLTAHLMAGTSLSTLRILAGSLSAQTLIELTELAIEGIDPHAAVLEGLRI